MGYQEVGPRLNALELIVHAATKLYQKENPSKLVNGVEELRNNDVSTASCFFQI